MKRSTVPTIAWMVAVCGCIVALIVYYRFDPAQHAWMPQCWFHRWTGWQCPACGNQRALHALLHGEWSAAWRYNRFLIVSLPYLLAVVWTTFDRRSCMRSWRDLVQHPRAILAYGVLVVGWWIGRNLWHM